MNEFNKAAGYKINTQKWTAFPCTKMNTMETGIKNKLPLIISPKWNLTKHVQGLYTEDYKT